jgi:hypothetical protein
MTKTHGGKRQNSGRKPLSKTQPTMRRTVTLLPAHVRWLQRRNPNVSVAIRELIAQEMKREQDNPIQN